LLYRSAVPALALILLCSLLAPLAAANVITEENARTGTDQWNVHNRAVNGEIEGYASATSVAPGETIRMYVNTVDPEYTIEVFRMGWYGGVGGRRMTNAVRRAAVKQTIPSPDPVTGLIECDWSDPYSLTIPGDWVSGVYVAKITALPSDVGSWIIFVVRAPAARNAPYLVQTSVTTYQAYNNWGGKSLYDFNSTGGRAFKVSFNRPYSRKSGAADFLLGYEYPMVRFLEREGYDVAYTTDIDTHEHGEELLRHAAFLDIGHDEYWTQQMRDAVERARDTGVNLAFFSANVCYWRIALEDGDRVIAISKDPSTLWRSSRPEDGLVGTMFTYTPVSGDVVIGDTSHWVFAGTGLRSGDRLGGLLGYEADRSTASAYPGTIVLTHSPFVHEDGTPDESNMTIYTARSGALVFATGTIYWAFGVDDYNLPLRSFAPPNEAAKQITRNVLNRMASRASVRRRAVK
jgi:hypothetical protein